MIEGQTLFENGFSLNRTNAINCLIKPFLAAVAKGGQLLIALPDARFT